MISRIIGATSTPILKIGDYVQMGKYYDEEILWRCVDIDENGSLMLADKILTIKSYDVKGIHKYIDGTDQAEVSWSTSRTDFGSNLWETSNMRSWLNSTATAGNVKWIDGCPPTAAKVTNGYANEKGFLAQGNFTASEQNAIKSVEQKSLLHSVDVNKLSKGGTDCHWFPCDDSFNCLIEKIVANYDNSYYHNVKDKMFLLDVKQLNKVYLNRSILGTNYWIGKPTQKAIDNLGDEYAKLSIDKYLNNWTRTPRAEASIYPSSVLYVNDGGSFGDGHINYDRVNVKSFGSRPAFYINLSSVSFKSGSGAEGAPYIVTR